MVVEILTFRLAPGASSDEFLAADARMQTDFYYLQPGIVRRTTARSGEDWCVVTFWQRQDDVREAPEFAALIDPSTLRAERYTTLD